MAKKIWDDWNDIPVWNLKGFIADHWTDIVFFGLLLTVATVMGFLA